MMGHRRGGRGWGGGGGGHGHGPGGHGGPFGGRRPLRFLARKLGLTRVSDLAAHPELALGFSLEFLNRADGWPAARGWREFCIGTPHDAGTFDDMLLCEYEYEYLYQASKLRESCVFLEGATFFFGFVFGCLMSCSLVTRSKTWRLSVRSLCFR